MPATGASLGIERILAALPGSEGRAWPPRRSGDRDGRGAGRASLRVRGPGLRGLRAAVYLGSSGKLGRQLKWASDSGARWSLIYGAAEDAAGTVTVRDMNSGEQAAVPVGALAGHLGNGLAAGLADGG